MKNILMLAFGTASAISLTACNGGSSPSSTNINNNGYNGTVAESYSASLPGGGILTTTTNMFYPANTNESTPLYLSVSGITGSVNVNFTIQPAVGSDGIQQSNIKLAAVNLPTIVSPALCAFESNGNESCTLTIDLNNAGAGSYTITPTLESTALTPLINFTVLTQMNYIIPDGTYVETVTGNYPVRVGFLPGCYIESAPSTYTYTVTNGYGCNQYGYCSQLIPGTTGNIFTAPLTTTYFIDNAGATWYDTFYALGYYNGSYNTQTTRSVCPGVVYHANYTLVN